MSKRGGELTHVRPTKVKKRRGVGSRTIAVPDSDDDSPPAATNDYAQVTRTRVGTSGKAERVTTSSVPISEVEMEKVDAHTSLDRNTGGSMDASAENDVSAVPAKQRKKANDSVSNPAL